MFTKKKQENNKEAQRVFELQKKLLFLSKQNQDLKKKYQEQLKIDEYHKEFKNFLNELYINKPSEQNVFKNNIDLPKEQIDPKKENFTNDTELVIDKLMSLFGKDYILKIPNEKKGINLLHKIIDDEKEKGIVAYELREENNFSNDYVKEFKRNLNQHGAHFGIYVVKNLSDSISKTNSSLEQWDDNVFICTFDILPIISKMLRIIVISIAKDKIISSFEEHKKVIENFVLKQKHEFLLNETTKPFSKLIDNIADYEIDGSDHTHENIINNKLDDSIMNSIAKTKVTKSIIEKTNENEVNKFNKKYNQKTELIIDRINKNELNKFNIQEIITESNIDEKEKIENIDELGIFDEIGEIIGIDVENEIEDYRDDYIDSDLLDEENDINIKIYDNESDEEIINQNLDFNEIEDEEDLLFGAENLKWK